MAMQSEDNILPFEYSPSPPEDAAPALDIPLALESAIEPTLSSKSKTTFCCGLFEYNGASSVARELELIERKLTKTDQAQGRWPWVDSIMFQSIFGGVIVFNSLCIGVDIETADKDGKSAAPMVVLESMFLVAFWVELGCRMYSHGLVRFCTDLWGPFDFGVTFLGSIDAWILTPLMGSSAALSGVSALRTLRLLRLFRLVRVFRAFSELSRLVKVLLIAFKSLTWVSLLLFVFLYTSAIMVRLLLKGHEDDTPELQQLTDTLGWTLFYHTMLVTAEGHLDVLVFPTTYVSDAWYLYWVFLIIFLNFFMVNLMVGLIVQHTLLSTHKDDAAIAAFVYEAEQFKRTLLQLFQDKDIDEDGYISVDELVRLMNTSTMSLIMAAFGIKTDVPQDFLLTIFGFEDGQKYISFKRFYESCVRICGASRDIRSFMLQYDIANLQKEVSQGIRQLGKKLGQKELAKRSLPERILQDPFMMPPPLPVSLQAGQLLGDKGAQAAAAAPFSKRSRDSKPKVVCDSRLGDGFSERFCQLAFKAKKRLCTLERRQEEMILSLCELRCSMFGASHRMIICCPSDHPLVPLGTADMPVGSAEYCHWACDAASEKGGCRHAESSKSGMPGSHLTRLRRYHCKVCRYDICEDCYNARQSERGVGKLSQAQTSSERRAAPQEEEIADAPVLERFVSVDTPTQDGGN